MADSENCLLFILSETLPQLMKNISIRNTSKGAFAGWKAYFAVYDRLSAFLSYLPAFISKVRKNANLNSLSLPDKPSRNAGYNHKNRLL